MIVDDWRTEEENGGLKLRQTLISLHVTFRKSLAFYIEPLGLIAIEIFYT
jgi:hypothetical protein